MAYGDTVDPKNRIISLILVVLITLFIGYGLVSGLAFDVAKKVIEKTTAFNVEEPPPPPPPETPPPPKEIKPEVAPPVVIPKSAISRPTENVVQAVDTPPAIAPVTTTVSPPTPAPPAPPPPPPPPPPPKQAAKGATPRGAPQNWVTTDDYPAGALREEKQGVTGVSVTVGADGRASNCTVTSSSGSGELDTKACSLVRSRGRWNPAEDSSGNKVAGSWRGSFRWQLPND